MNKLYAIIIGQKETNSIIYTKYRIGKLGLFGIKTVKDYLEDGIKTLINKIEEERKIEIISDEFGGILFTFIKKDSGIGVGIITTVSFPNQTILYLLNRCFEIISREEEDSSLKVKQLDDLFDHFAYKQTMELSQEERIQKELDETTEELDLIIQKIIKRKEDLEELIIQSQVLSESAQRYLIQVKKSKKKRRRCHICSIC